jgi:hypothetical protein
MLDSNGGRQSANGGGGAQQGTFLSTPVRMVGIRDEDGKLSSATVLVAVHELLERLLASEHSCELPQEHEIAHQLVPLREWPVVKTVW